MHQCIYYPLHDLYGMADFLDRRYILKTVGAIGITGVAGCNSQDGNETEKIKTPDAYEYFFDDQAGTLGTAASDQIPDNASDEQIIRITRSETQWREMQLNDHHIAELTLVDEYAPFSDLEEGSIEGIVEATKNIYEKRSKAINSGKNEFVDPTNAYHQQNVDLSGYDEAEIYTSSVLSAVNKETDVSTAIQKFINPTLAEWILEEHMDINIPDYRWSNTSSKIGDAGIGYSHPLGLLQYSKNGEQQVKYAEIEPRPTEMIVEPEDSVYYASLELDSFTTAQNREVDPTEYVSAFDYTKMREMESRGLTDPPESEGQLFRSFLSFIDDASMNGYDMAALEEDGRIDESGVEANNIDTSEWIKGITSDSFGESLEEYIISPGEEYTRDDFETTARAIYRALEKQGFAGPIAVDGDLSNPRVLHPTEKQVQAIRDNQHYDQVASTILT